MLVPVEENPENGLDFAPFAWTEQGPGLMRARFCRALGIDEVGNGKALTNVLNRYFSRADYAAALKTCQLPQGKGQQGESEEAKV